MFVECRGVHGPGLARNAAGVDIRSLGAVCFAVEGAVNAPVVIFHETPSQVVSWKEGDILTLNDVANKFRSIGARHDFDQSSLTKVVLVRANLLSSITRKRPDASLE